MKTGLPAWQQADMFLCLALTKQKMVSYKKRRTLFIALLISILKSRKDG